MVLAVLAAAVAGLLASPALRAVIITHAVPAGQPWRDGCPHCDARRRALVWPAARCRICGGRVGPVPGAIELLAAAAAAIAATAVVTGPRPTWSAGVALVVAALFAVVLAGVDLAVHRLPDRLTLAGFGATAAILAGAAALAGDWRRLGTALIGATALTAGYGVLWLLPRRGLGFGDVKLAPLVGLTTGWFGLATTGFAAVVGLSLAGLTAVALLIARRATWQSRVAHGPFMLLGAAVAVLAAR